MLSSELTGNALVDQFLVVSDRGPFILGLAAWRGDDTPVILHGAGGDVRGC